MADMEWQDEGWPELITELLAESVDAAKNAVDDAANHMRNSVVSKLSGKRTGRTYKVSATGKPHIASRPGEPPAVLFGKLRQNVSATRATVDGNEVSAQVGVDGQVVPYARRLELGGFHIAQNGRAVYMAPRPFLRPTFFEQEQTVINILERAVGGR
jgi:hypothetical protein